MAGTSTYEGGTETRVQFCTLNATFKSWHAEEKKEDYMTLGSPCNAQKATQDHLYHLMISLGVLPISTICQLGIGLYKASPNASFTSVIYYSFIVCTLFCCW